MVSIKHLTRFQEISLKAQIFATYGIAFKTHRLAIWPIKMLFQFSPQLLPSKSLHPVLSDEVLTLFMYHANQRFQAFEPHNHIMQLTFKRSKNMQNVSFFNK